MYAKIETERLLFLHLNQTNLRSEEYIHLQDSFVNDSNIIYIDISKSSKAGNLLSTSI